MNPFAVTLATAGLIVASAFFVILEFALLGARRHRLEAEAETSRSARAALRGINELTMMLAGAQLGITVCTFALGAITKPAVDAWLGPLLQDIGVPGGVASTTSFVLSLVFVTFLHLVVGEMAPKSWAIAHPETSAKAVALAGRAYLWPLRPLLGWVNRIANRLVAASGVEPVDRAAVGGHDVDSIRQLVEHSGQEGVLEERHTGGLTQVLELERLTIGELAQGATTSVPEGATVGDVQAASAESGHLRVLLDGGEPRYVHVRDTLVHEASAPVGDLDRAALQLDGAVPVYEAFARMRRESEELALVTRDGARVGVVTVADIVRRVLPLSSHTGQPPGGRRTGGGSIAP